MSADDELLGEGARVDGGPAEAAEFIDDDQDVADESDLPDPESDEALEVDEDTVGDGSDEFVSENAAESGRSPDVNDEAEFVSGNATDSVDSADTNDQGVSDELADTIDSEIHELAAERDTYKDIAQRLQADFENYRKRVSSQIAGEIDRATGRMAEALLPVLDAAEAAYVQLPDEVGPLLNLMLTELRKHGLETIDLLDKPFDPNLADAVAHEPGDGGEVVVADVLRSGYSWNGRTLRPAMVRTRD